MQSPRHTIDFDSFYGIHYLSNPSFSPDGKTIAFIVKKATDSDGYDSDVYLYRNDRTEKLPVMGNVRNYCWAQEDRIVVSIPSGAEWESAFEEIDIHSGKTIQSFRVPLKDASLSRVGTDKYLVLGRSSHYEPRADEIPNRVTTLTEIPYWGEFGLGYTSQTRKQLGVFNAAANEWKPITPKLYEVVNFEIADGLVSIVGMEYDTKGTRLYSLYIYNLETEKLESLIPQDQMHIFRSAPFGKEIVFCGNEASPFEPKREDKDFYRFSLENGKFERFFEYEHSVGEKNVSTDSALGAGRMSKRYLDRWYFLSTRFDEIGLYSISLKGDFREEVKNGGAVLSFDIHEQGIVTCSMIGQRPAELYLNGERITHFNDEWVAANHLLGTEYNEVITSDGYDIHGWVMKPQNYEPGKKYPAILHIHGGPPIIFSDILFYEHQLWTAKGYFVIFCNPRGSDGRGFEFRNLTGKYGDWDYRSIMDYLDGVLPRYPDIDPNRLGVTGGSYGGYMTNWIVGQTNRFAAAVSQRSISNWITFEYTAIRGYYHSVYKHGTTAGENPDLLYDCSPLKYAERCTTPTLIIHSDNDHVCWLGEGLMMFAALKTAGCPSKMCIFHGEDHELSRSGKPLNRIRRMQEIVEWFDQYLKPE